MKRLLAALLAAALLTGCAAAPVKKEKKTPAKPGIYASAAGLDPAAELLRADGQSVSAGRYLYWLAEICGKIQEECGGEADWSATRSGRTLAEYAADQALRAAKFCAVLESNAQKCGCALTEDERRSISTQADRRAAALGLDTESARKFCADSVLYGKLYRKFCTKNSGIYPDEAALARFAAARKLPTEDAWPAYFDAWLEQAALHVGVKIRPACKALNVGVFYRKLCALRKAEKERKTS
jgi:hypothetical protein